VSVKDEGRLVVGKDGTLLALLEPPHSGVAHNKGSFEADQVRASLPAIGVTWEGADLYCKAQGKTLPTEAQWENAARGSERRTFPWGADDKPACNSVSYGRREGLLCAKESGVGPEDVGTSPLDKTPEGVHDLGGNVGEWVLDDYVDRYDTSCGPDCRDPVAVVDASGRSEPAKKVARGGYFDANIEAARAAGRSKFPIGSPMLNVGFRCVKLATKDRR
jgi:formylglycine-generating enzyme required for sulfatase activity